MLVLAGDSHPGCVGSSARTLSLVSLENEKQPIFAQKNQLYCSGKPGARQGSALKSMVALCAKGLVQAFHNMQLLFTKRMIWPLTRL